MTDDDLDAAFRRYFAEEITPLETTPTFVRQAPPASRRSTTTLAVAVAIGLGVAVALPPPRGPRPGPAAPGTNFLNEASADGSRLPAAKLKPRDAVSP